MIKIKQSLSLCDIYMQARMLDSLLGLFEGELDTRVVGGAVRKVCLAKLAHTESIPSKKICDIFHTTSRTLDNARQSCPSFARANMLAPLSAAVENILGRDGLRRSDALGISLTRNIHEWFWAHCSYNKVIV